MRELSLPKELVSLIYHVELNNSGWKDKLVEQVVLSSCVAKGEPLSIHNLNSIISSDFGVNIPQSTLERSINELIKKGVFVKTIDSSVKITEQARLSLEK